MRDSPVHSLAAGPLPPVVAPSRPAPPSAGSSPTPFAALLHQQRAPAPVPPPEPPGAATVVPSLDAAQAKARTTAPPRPPRPTEGQPSPAEAEAAERPGRDMATVESKGDGEDEQGEAEPAAVDAAGASTPAVAAPVAAPSPAAAGTPEARLAAGDELAGSEPKATRAAGALRGTDLRAARVAGRDARATTEPVPAERPLGQPGAAADDSSATAASTASSGAPIDAIGAGTGSGTSIGTGTGTDHRTGNAAQAPGPASAPALPGGDARPAAVDSPLPSHTLATPFDAPEFASSFGLQVSRLAREGVHRAELHLNPADMGPVSVTISLDGAVAQVDFGADVAATRKAIEAGLPELASSLKDAGFTLGGGGVSEHAGSRRDADDAGEGAGRESARRARAGGGAVPVEGGSLARLQRIAAGRIDVFA